MHPQLQKRPDLRLELSVQHSGSCADGIPLKTMGENSVDGRQEFSKVVRASA
jgi:hypothetical protein